MCWSRETTNETALGQCSRCPIRHDVLRANRRQRHGCCTPENRRLLERRTDLRPPPILLPRLTHRIINHKKAPDARTFSFVIWPHCTNTSTSCVKVPSSNDTRALLWRVAPVTKSMRGAASLCSSIGSPSEEFGTTVLSAR